jgi:hypothetical protein
LSEIEKHGDIAMGLSKLMNREIKKYPISSFASKNPKLSDADKHQCTLSSFLEELLNLNTNTTSKAFKQFGMEELKSPSQKKKPLIKDTKNRQKPT